MAMTSTSDRFLADRIRHHAFPLIGTRSDLDPLMEMIGERSIVLLGEATHGSHEFYKTRFEITRRLIEEKGFAAIALEADWPDAIRVNRYIRGQNGESSVMEALSAFQRFPMWMWRNTEFLRMVEWLLSHNQRESTANKVSLFGIDLYSLYTSIREVIGYLKENEPGAATKAKNLYSCFDHYGGDPIRYGRFVRIGAQSSCEEAAIEAAVLLFEGQGRVLEHEEQDAASIDELFYARQNAELIRSAESYYRNLFSPLVNTWNVRDRHMADTVDNVLSHLEEQGQPKKIVIWAHNSHIGDDRATEMGWQGQWNLGQLLRERHPDHTFNLGFTTYEGLVTAADQWDRPPNLKVIQPALSESFEALFHKTGLSNFLLPLDIPEIRKALNQERLERAIGVVYAPDTERESHYFHARLSEQFDAVMHFDRTSGVDPLDRQPQVELEEPSGVQL